MVMSRRAVCLLAVLLMLGAGLISPSIRLSSVQAATSSKCKTVKKKGHKVKVCPKKKPTPKPKNTPTPKPTATPVIVPDVMAQQLTDRVVSASSDTDRSQAIAAIYRAIDIGIYDSATGARVSPGMESSNNDYYAFSQELPATAASYSSGHRYSLAGLAGTLTAAGVSENAKPVSATDLATLVVALTQWAQAHPSDHAALVPLLVRDLGLKDSPAFDTAKDASQLDGLQLQLVSVYLVAPIIHSLAHVATARRYAVGASATDGFCRGMKVILNPFNPNSYLTITGGPDQVNWVADNWAGSTIGEILTGIGAVSSKVANALNILNLLSTFLHGLVMGSMLYVQTDSSTVQETHYGPAEPDHDANAGKQLRFKATVLMAIQIDKSLQTCLHEAGIDVPDKGPVPGVGVDWDNVAGDIEQYGTVSYDPADQKTGDGTGGTQKGVATMLFTPKTEKIPGFGVVITSSGSVHPFAMWGLAFNNTLGALANVLTPTYGDPISWKVSRHEAVGFRFDNLSAKFYSGPAAYPLITDTAQISGQLCGDDPFADPWKITLNTVDVASPNPPAGITTTRTYTLQVVFDRGTGLGTIESGLPSGFTLPRALSMPGGAAVAYLQLSESTIPGTPKLTMQLYEKIDTTGLNAPITPVEQTVKQEVLPDPSCVPSH